MTPGPPFPGTVDGLLDLRAGDGSAGLIEVGTVGVGTAGVGTVGVGTVGVGTVEGDATFGGRWTWREVVEAADRVGAWLRSLPGDGPFHGGVFMENTPAHLFTRVGAARAGAVVVGLTPTRRGAELARDVLHTDCRVVVTDGAGVGLLDAADLQGVPVVVVEDRTGLPAGAASDEPCRSRPTLVQICLLPSLAVEAEPADGDRHCAQCCSSSAVDEWAG